VKASQTIMIGQTNKVDGMGIQGKREKVIKV
jgi:hypothetical protein